METSSQKSGERTSGRQDPPKQKGVDAVNTSPVAWKLGSPPQDQKNLDETLKIQYIPKAKEIIYIVHL